jgi:hypothetical protein
MYYDWNYTYTVGQVHDKRSGIFLCQLLVSEGCVKKKLLQQKNFFCLEHAAPQQNTHAH